MRVSKFILIIISFYLSACSNVHAQNTDSSLINKTLIEILNKKDVFYIRGKGKNEVVLLENSLTIDPESKKLIDQRPIKEECIFSKEQNTSFTLNNKKSITLKSVVKKSNSHRFINKGESDFIGRNIFSSKVKSYITISKPGYSTDNTAIVIASYTWSLHGAFAKFIYKKTQDSWELTCSEYIIHP